MSEEEYQESKDKGELFSKLPTLDNIRARINRVFEHSQKWSDSSSYGLKHVLEQSGTYVSNGDFIMAMIHGRHIFF